MRIAIYLTVCLVTCLALGVQAEPVKQQQPRRPHLRSCWCKHVERWRCETRYVQRRCADYNDCREPSIWSGAEEAECYRRQVGEGSRPSIGDAPRR